MTQYTLYRRKDGKWYEPVLTTQDESYAVRWAIEYSYSGPRDTVWSVWKQPLESPRMNQKKVRRPVGVQVSADQRGRGIRP